MLDYFIGTNYKNFDNFKKVYTLVVGILNFLFIKKGLRLFTKLYSSKNMTILAFQPNQIQGLYTVSNQALRLKLELNSD